MELKHIEYFCLVAETENMTSAAQALMTSQPYISKKNQTVRRRTRGSIIRLCGQKHQT